MLIHLFLIYSALSLFPPLNFSPCSMKMFKGLPSISHCQNFGFRINNCCLSMVLYLKPLFIELSYLESTELLSLSSRILIAKSNNIFSVFTLRTFDFVCCLVIKILSPASWASLFFFFAVVSSCSSPLHVYFIFTLHLLRALISIVRVIPYNTAFWWLCGAWKPG